MYKKIDPSIVDHTLTMGEKKKIALIAHDVDVKALLRIAVVYNVPVACDRSSAEFMITSALLDESCKHFRVDSGKRLMKLSKQ